MKHQDTEDLLNELGVQWTYIEALELEQIDQGASLANQARLEPLDQEVVERYQAAYEEAEDFPALLVRKGRGKQGMLLLGGNHRYAGAVGAGKTHHDVYLVVGTGEVLSRLMYEDNRRHGLPPSTEERVMAARHLMAGPDGLSAAAAARAVGVGKGKLDQAIAVVGADRRAEEMAVEGWSRLGHTQRWRLSFLDRPRVFRRAAELTVAANLRANEVFDLVTDLNTVAEADDHEQLDRLARWKDTLEDRVKTGSRDNSTGHTARGRFLQSVTALRLIDPADVAEAFGDASARQREALAEQIKEAARVMQAVLQKVT